MNQVQILVGIQRFILRTRGKGKREIEKERSSRFRLILVLTLKTNNYANKSIQVHIIYRYLSGEVNADYASIKPASGQTYASYVAITIYIYFTFFFTFISVESPRARILNRTSLALQARRRTSFIFVYIIPHYFSCIFTDVLIFLI